MRIIYIIMLAVLFVGCKTQPFVKHSLEFEKIADSCANQASAISMNSNLNGERFEFQSCLDADFKKEQVTSYQPNDTTVTIKFERKNAQQALFKLTIDVDAWPRYSLLILDGDSIQMKRVEP